jgi:hypothetical protein
MISFKPSKALGLVLASAGILFHAHSALAADVLEDTQMQARDLLSGTVGARSRTTQETVATSAGDAHAFKLEPQEQARQLILGKPRGDSPAGRVMDSDLEMTSVRGVRRAAGDPQEAARRMLLAVGV